MPLNETEDYFRGRTPELGSKKEEQGKGEQLILDQPGHWHHGQPYVVIQGVRQTIPQVLAQAGNLRVVRRGTRLDRYRQGV